MSAWQVKDIKKALNELYSDTSVPPERTREELEEIREEIDGLLDTLPPKHQ